MRAKRVSIQVFMGILNQAREKAQENGNESLAEIYGKATEEIKEEINSSEKKALNLVLNWKGGKK